VSLYYSANGINPCLAHRPVSGAGSPDGQSYFVDTYIKLTASSATQRAYKQITVIVRDGVTGKALVKEISTLDCGTANPPGSPPC
jgi:hypothetical protein